MIKLYLIIKNFYILDYQVIRGFFGTLTCLTPKKKCTYILHTISPVKMCHSWKFGHLQRNICHKIHTCQISIQDEAWPLLSITITSLPSTQKHFDWAHTYILTCGIRFHVQTCTIERDQWIVTEWNIDKENRSIEMIKIKLTTDSAVLAFWAWSVQWSLIKCLIWT